MCGIIGYIGPRPVVPIILDGLKRLEYRGYDSAGIAVVKDGVMDVRRSAGKLANLEQSIWRRRSMATMASVIRDGPRTAARPRRTRIPIAMAAAASSWCTTASSRTIWS